MYKYTTILLLILLLSSCKTEITETVQAINEYAFWSYIDNKIERIENKEVVCYVIRWFHEYSISCIKK